jgi:hypothetical protein
MVAVVKRLPFLFAVYQIDARFWSGGAKCPKVENYGK